MDGYFLDGRPIIAHLRRSGVRISRKIVLRFHAKKTVFILLYSNYFGTKFEMRFIISSS
jgi:hypothetical protein